MSTLEENYQYCHQIMKDYSKSFSYAFDMLPEQQRRAIWAIYAVCRIVDDSIDVHKTWNIYIRLTVMLKLLNIKQQRHLKVMTAL